MLAVPWSWDAEIDDKTGARVSTFPRSNTDDPVGRYSERTLASLQVVAEAKINNDLIEALVANIVADHGRKVRHSLRPTLPWCWNCNVMRCSAHVQWGPCT